MKIQKNKNNNISEESKNALRNFHQNHINSNIRLHKIFFIIVILINIGLISFIFFYKSKISQIKKLYNTHSKDIDSEDSQLVMIKRSFNNKMVNIMTSGLDGALRFSLIFEKSEEFQKIKKIIYDYQYGNEVTSNLEELKTYFIYQGWTDSDVNSIFIEKISFFESLTILIQTENGYKFGIYHKGVIIPNDKQKFYSDSKDVILFTFDSNKIYKFKGKKNSMHFNKNILFSLGDDELVVYNEYFNNGGYIDFPLKSFDFSTISNNILTGENGKFNIRNIEVYCFFGL